MLLLRLTIAFCLISLYGNGQPPTAPLSAAEQEVYTIYSLVFASPQVASDIRQNSRYFIEAMTRPDYPDLRCLHLPTEYEKRTAEVRVDFQRVSGDKGVQPVLTCP